MDSLLFFFPSKTVEWRQESIRVACVLTALTISKMAFFGYKIKKDTGKEETVTVFLTSRKTKLTNHWPQNLNGYRRV